MNWFTVARRLRRLGVLGMNARNSRSAGGLSPRAAFAIVDDKLTMSQVCERVGIPSPAMRAVFEHHRDLRLLAESLAASPDCVLKPARGAGGRGVIVLLGQQGKSLIRHNGALVSVDELRRHLADVLSGMFSLGGRPDRALLQERVRPHPAFERIAYRGTPDVRVVVYRGTPIMAMLRLPTLESAGRANLHQGGVGVGVDLESGRTMRAIWHGQRVDRHPDTGESLVDRLLPNWSELLTMSQKTARATGLGYVGVDLVLDEDRGPLLLEANARPGLAIQLATGLGLRHAMNKVDLVQR